MRERPAAFAAATMRSASRPLKPGQPASTSIDSPEGDTTSVACPPSTSMKRMSSGLVVCDAVRPTHSTVRRPTTDTILRVIPSSKQRPRTNDERPRTGSSHLLVVDKDDEILVALLLEAVRAAGTRENRRAWA